MIMVRTGMTMQEVISHSPAQLCLILEESERDRAGRSLLHLSCLTAAIGSAVSKAGARALQQLQHLLTKQVDGAEPTDDRNNQAEGRKTVAEMFGRMKR